MVPKTYSKIFSEIIKNFWCFSKLYKLRPYKINTMSSGREKKRNRIEKPKNILKDRTSNVIQSEELKEKHEKKKVEKA